MADWLKGLTGYENEFVINVALIVVGLAMLAYVRDFFNGALFNPSNNVALIIRGKGGGLLVNLIRMLGQLIGALMGSFSALSIVPSHLQG